MKKRDPLRFEKTTRRYRVVGGRAEVLCAFCERLVEWDKEAGHHPWRLAPRAVGDRRTDRCCNRPERHDGKCCRRRRVLWVLARRPHEPFPARRDHALGVALIAITVGLVAAAVLIAISAA